MRPRRSSGTCTSMEMHAMGVNFSDWDNKLVPVGAARFAVRLGLRQMEECARTLPLTAGGARHALLRSRRSEVTRPDRSRCDAAVGGGRRVRFPRSRPTCRAVGPGCPGPYLDRNPVTLHERRARSDRGPCAREAGAPQREGRALHDHRRRVRRHQSRHLAKRMERYGAAVMGSRLVHVEGRIQRDRDIDPLIVDHLENRSDAFDRLSRETMPTAIAKADEVLRPLPGQASRHPPKCASYSRRAASTDFGETWTAWRCTSSQPPLPRVDLDRSSTRPNSTGSASLPQARQAARHVSQR